MGIQQINASYVADEDRLLLRVTTSQAQEYRLWLTRAVVAKFLDVSDKAVVSSLAKQHPEEQAKAIAEFQEESLAAKETFSEPFKPVKDLPLGEAPLLVVGIKATVERSVCHLGLQLANRHTLTLHLGNDLLLRTKLLLKKIVTKARWFHPSNLDVHVSVGSGAENMLSSASKVIH